MTLETFSPRQVEAFKEFDTNLGIVERIKRLTTISAKDQEYYESANTKSFECYYDLTRHIFLEEGKQMIIRDKDMEKAASIYLVSHGFPQYWG